MYRRIGLFALILATGITVNAGSAKAQELAPSVAIGGVANGKPLPLTVTPAVTNAQTAVACNVCFTCGGDWPVFAGELPTASAADERGSACTGTFGFAANDHVPFLCCR
jgi:hypothetical protein